MSSVTHAKPSEVDLVHKFQRYIHMKAFDAHGARLYSDSPADVISLLKKLKNEDAEFSRRRRQTVEALVALPLGESVNRIVAACQDAVQRKKIPS